MMGIFKSLENSLRLIEVLEQWFLILSLAIYVFIISNFCIYVLNIFWSIKPNRPLNKHWLISFIIIFISRKKQTWLPIRMCGKYKITKFQIEKRNMNSQFFPSMLSSFVAIICLFFAWDPSLVFSNPSPRLMGFPGGSDGKESTCHVGDLDSIPGLGRSPGGHGNPPQNSCLENPHGERRLAGYSPQGRKQSDMTEQLSTAQHSTSNKA